MPLLINYIYLRKCRLDVFSLREYSVSLYKARLEKKCKFIILDLEKTCIIIARERGEIDNKDLISALRKNSSYYI